MIRFRVWAFAVAVAASLALPAAAQIRNYVAPGPGPADGITVTATGDASAPAARAKVELRIISRGAIDAATFGPVVDALVRAGVSRSDIVVPAYYAVPGAPGERNTTLTFTVDRPTKAMVESALPGVALAFVTAGLNVNSATVVLSTGSCDPLQAAARALALKNARKRADSYASDLGIRVGSVRAVAGYDAPVNAAGACETIFQLPYGGPDPQASLDSLSVSVSVGVTVRYAIR